MQVGPGFLLFALSLFANSAFGGWGCGSVLSLAQHEDRVRWSSLLPVRALAESIGWIGARAVKGDSAASQTLRAYSEGTGDVALAAQNILSHWQTLTQMAHATDRLQFYSTGVAWTEHELSRMTAMLLDGRNPEAATEIANQAKLFFEGATAVMECLRIGLEVPDSPSVSHRAKFREMAHRFGNHRLYLYKIATTIHHTNNDTLAGAAQALGSIIPDRRSIAGLVRQALTRNLLFAVTSGVEFRIDVAESVTLSRDPYLTGESDVIEGVVFDLVQNAIKYSSPNREHKWIEVSVRDNTLSVSDNGIGIEQPELIFTYGFREGRNSAKGEGLGLALWKQDLDKFGLSLTLASSSPNGSVFSIDLATVLK